MEFVNLKQKIGEAHAQKIRNSHFFGTANFRSWMLYFEPGDGTDMHYHVSPESFLVLEGKGSVKGIKEKERGLLLAFYGGKETEGLRDERNLIGFSGLHAAVEG